MYYCSEPWRDVDVVVARVEDRAIADGWAEGGAHRVEPCEFRE